MTADGYLVRRYHPEDFEALVELRNASAALAADGSYQSPEEVRSSLARPGCRPEQDIFVAEVDGAVVAFLRVTDETRIGRAVLDGMVLPEHRRKGLGRQLFCLAAARARSMGATAAHISVREGNDTARRILSRAGFRPVRRFRELEVELAGIPTPSGPRYPVRRFEPGDEEALAAIQNRAFSGSWGYCPNTVEEVRHATGSPDSRRWILLAWDGARPVGYHWGRLERRRKTGDVRGRTAMVGVDPDYRGQGIGRHVLLAGLADFRWQGIRAVQLTVDSENVEAGALYRSIGFKEIDASLWYEKELPRQEKP